MILVPEAAWARVLDGFAETIDGVERVAFLDGVRASEIAVVTTVTFPDAVLLPGTYDVSAEAMSRAGRHLRQHELTRLAQVHTHGGADCRHSPRDDEMAYTERAGAVSIVLPYHAALRPGPTEGLVHVRTENDWCPLDPEAAHLAVGVLPSTVDQRTVQWLASPTVTKERSMAYWHRFKRLLRRP